MTNLNPDTVDTIAALAVAATEPETVTVGGDRSIQVFQVPDTHHLVTFEADPVAPRRRSGIYRVRDLPSFVQFFGKHAGPNAEIYADLDQNVITAVLNAPGGGDDTSYNDHRLVLDLRPSRQYKAWTELEKKELVPQAGFAQFIEDHSLDIVEPSSAELLQVARTIKATKAVDFEAGVDLVNGAVVFKYAETIGAKAGHKGEMEIPERIAIGIPLWDGGTLYKVTARLRYRITKDGLYLGIRLDQIEDSLDDGFSEYIGAISKVLTDGQLILSGPSPAQTSPVQNLSVQRP